MNDMAIFSTWWLFHLDMPQFACSTGQEDCTQLQKWMARDRSLTRPEIQNELILLIAHHLLRMILASIKKSIHFAIIVDGIQNYTR